MICNNCGKEHSLIYPESVNTRLRNKMICIECERWIDLIDEIQINPEHIVLKGKYYIIESKTWNEVKNGNYFAFYKLDAKEILIGNSIYCVGAIPERFQGFFPNCAMQVEMEEVNWNGK